MKSTFLSDVWEPIRTFLRAPFEQLPPQYGNTLPPELLVFEAQAEEAQRHAHEMGEGLHAHHAASKPIKVGSGNKPQASA
jgi:hypothetical protein